MNEIKNAIIEKISNYSNNTSVSNNHIFYIYNTIDDTIISTGIIGKNNFTRSGKTVIHGNEYLFIHYLLSKEKRNRGGINAIYHIFKRLSDKYKGICLRTTTNSESFYKHLGFTEYEDLMILDKTPENIHKLEAKLPHPITTEFYSTYPDNIII